MTGAYPFVNGVRDNGSFRFDGAAEAARQLVALADRSSVRAEAFVGALP